MDSFLFLILLVLVLVALSVVGYCVVRASTRGDRLAAEIDARLFVDPETLSHAEQGTRNAEQAALLRSVVELPHGRDAEIRDHALGLPSSEGSGVGSGIRHRASGIETENENEKEGVRRLIVPLEIEVHPSTRFPGIPAALFENQLRMVCAKGARAYLDGETLGPEPVVSVALLPVPQIANLKSEI